MKEFKTQIIKINPSLVEQDKIAVIAQTLIQEGVIAYPTDTFYGLGANCFSKMSIHRIYQIKKRKQVKPLSVVISDLEMVEDIVTSIPPLFSVLSTKFWPGPLTLILKAGHQFPEEILGPGRTLGIRLPRLSWLREVVRKVGFPITATSANLSGEKEISDPRELIKVFGGKVDLIVDGGKTQAILPSTIVDLASVKPKIVREGAIPRNRLIPYLEAMKLD